MRTSAGKTLLVVFATIAILAGRIETRIWTSNSNVGNGREFFQQHQNLEEGAMFSETGLGIIPPIKPMISTRILEPRNLAKFPAGKEFKVRVAALNLKFSNMTKSDDYFLQVPQQQEVLTVGNDETIVVTPGQMAVTVERIDMDAAFRAWNEKRVLAKNEAIKLVAISEMASNGKFAELKLGGKKDGRRQKYALFQYEAVIAGDNLKEPGQYRVCCMPQTENTIVPVAKHGAQHDCVRVEIR